MKLTTKNTKLFTGMRPNEEGFKPTIILCMALNALKSKDLYPTMSICSRAALKRGKTADAISAIGMELSVAKPIRGRMGCGRISIPLGHWLWCAPSPCLTLR